MELLSPSEIALNKTTEQLATEVAELAHRVNAARPLSPEVLVQIQKELLSERVYNSNSIEGNPLTLRETIAVLESGLIIDVGRKRDATEVVNLGNAIHLVQDLVANRNEWADQSQFMNVHRTLMSGIDDSHAGILRSERVMISGAKHQPPRGERVAPLLDQFFARLNESTELEPIRLATWVHWSISRIHPFLDGNGRMARLWQDLVLFGSRYTAAIIKLGQRNEYYKALSAADDGDFNLLAQMIGLATISGLQVYINAQREHDEIKGWATEIVGEHHAREQEQRNLAFIRWSLGVERVRDAFQRCATQITDVADNTLSVQILAYGFIDQPTWESLRSGAGASKTWYFWVNFRKGEKRIAYCFFFGQHYCSSLDLDIGVDEPSVSLLVSEQVGQERATRLDLLEETPVSLREVIFVDGNLIRKRLDVTTGIEVYDTDIDPVVLARDFISEVLLKRLA